MASAQDNGWNFLNVGETYQYKEGKFIAIVQIVEDNSSDDFYQFVIEILEATSKLAKLRFEISCIKSIDFGYPGMVHYFDKIEFKRDYHWNKSMGLE
jgi:hypothetical protein